MKKCKCIDTTYFDNIGKGEYQIYKGCIYNYQIYDMMVNVGDGVLHPNTIIEIK